MFEFGAWGGAWLLIADIAVMLALAAAMLGAARMYCARMALPLSEEAAAEASFRASSTSPRSGTR